MNILKNLEAFEKAIKTLELDITEKVDETSKEKQVCRFMTASKYEIVDKSFLSFMERIKPTHKQELESLTTGIYQDALMMDLKQIEGVYDRISLLKKFIEEKYEKNREHLFYKEDYYSAEFFNDVLYDFTIEANGIDLENSLNDKVLVNQIFNALFVRTFVIREILMFLKKLWKEKGGEIEEIKKTSTTEPKGFNLGVGSKELELLYTKLTDNSFLDPNTNKDHFLSAFNGGELIEGYVPLVWSSPTECAMFFGYIREITSKRKVSWNKLIPLLADKASNYKHLLDQANNNGSYDTFKKVLLK